jgi:hypothetical protein
VHLERLREPRAGFGPGHGLDLDAAPRARDATKAIAKLATNTAEVEVPPQSFSSIIGRGLAPAVATTTDLPGGTDVDDDALVVEFEVGDERVLESDEGSE